MKSKKKKWKKCSRSRAYTTILSVLSEMATTQSYEVDDEELCDDDSWEPEAWDDARGTRRGAAAARRSSRKDETHVNKFLQMFMKDVGETCMTSKLHGISHIADDLRNFKCQLYAMSAYTFENAIGEIRRKLRSGNKPLQQMRLFSLSY